MQKNAFPWLRAVPRETETEAPLVEEAKKPPWLEGLQKSAPLLAFVGLILALYAFRGSSSSTPLTEPNRSVEVLVVMLPTPKGSSLIPETLKQIPVTPKSLSKTQMLQLVRFEDLAKVQSQVRAKKDLPPNKPLFWSDLELRPSNLLIKPTQVIYSKD